MELNKKDKVINITAMNDDADEIITENMAGLQIEEVLAILVANAKAKGYFDEDKDIEGNENLNTMLITTVETKKDNDDIDEFLANLIEEEYEGYNIILVEAEEKELEEAEEEGVSVGIRMLEKLRENAAEMGETERNEVSVRAFFYSLDDDDLDELAQTEGVHFNQVLMKRAIELHKEAVSDAKEVREEEREERKDDKIEEQKDRKDDKIEEQEDRKDDQDDSPGNSGDVKDKVNNKDKEKDNNKDKDKDVLDDDDDDDNADSDD